ncbi:MAG: apolipoprotein N-acyltransferase [Sphingomonadales bacterium]|jgi:apolipoprotein N-acyltransferase|nr:apolipoprotein N-acyltransferase [Sphingomonadales bacterium]MBK9004474.1 apolipoprotein N-acyltransferase [Sphingomonadales bacterium]MBK9269660.1 apolipoprotein N-acyltransferase [Sphingomonadales bacterium]MBP6434248.1 apolipoprotein N-acyltransferase [Sphingorhabdus sp.]
MAKLLATLEKHRGLALLVAGGISATGFAPLGLWPLTLLGLALLMHLVANAESGKHAFLLGWLFGVGHFAIGNNWIATAFTYQAAMPAWLGWVAVFLLALYLALFPALVCLGAWGLANIPPRHGEGDHAQHGGGARAEIPAINSSGHAAGAPPPPTSSAVPLPVPGRISPPFILTFAGCWIIAEWLRSWLFTGFAWNPLGVVAVGDAAAPAIFIGSYGLSGLVAMSSGILLLVTCRKWCQAIILTLALAIFSAVALFSFSAGGVGVALKEKAIGKRYVDLTIAQPNISQIDKYAPGYDALNFARLARHSQPKGEAPRLILWPEAAIPWRLEDGYPFRYYQFQPGENAQGARLALMRLMNPGDVLLTGIDRLEFDKDQQLVGARNGVTAMDSSGQILATYDKAHLVPYGEYLALRWLLEPLGATRLVPGAIDFWPGPGPRTLDLPFNGQRVKAGMQICYEIIFSGQVTDRANRPDFLFNPSNDAWFGHWGPPQHLAQARLRAIEEGLPVIRATPTGISAVIDADGRIVKSLPLGKAGRIDTRLPTAKAPTLFARFGNILPLAFAALLIAFAFIPLARRRFSR